MSQMPEMPAAGWAEQDYDPSAYPRQAEAQPAQTAAAVWQQDTEPDWGASQQGYPENEYPQEYPGQEYQGHAYPEQSYPQQSYQAQSYQGQAYPAYPAPAAAPEAAEGSGLPTEFDHLFRDSTPDSRRAIDRQKPMVGGAGAGYLAAAQSAAAQQQAAAAPPAPETAAAHDQAAAPPQGAPYQPYQQPYPQQGEQFPGASGAYQGAGYEGGGQYPGQYQGAQFQNGYPQADYQQGAGYGEPGAGFGGGPGGGGSFGGNGGGPLGGRLRERRTLVIGGAVVLAAVIGIVIATSNGSPAAHNAGSGGGAPSAAPSTKASPKQQADQIYQLIQQSSQLRSDANTAVVEVNGCKNLADAQNTLSSTAQKRQAQADSVGKLDVSGIQDGAQLVSQLKAAWTASAQYDNAYSQIAGDMQKGCKADRVKDDSNQQAVSQAAGAADTAKGQAAQLWNANVATPLGEAQVSSDKL